ncbi:glycosyltransferase [Actinoplanes sp. NPDC026670]|uniref:glycosyltransferase n=1 Tax=Actinoplanes sp. NPDC026670 TaxID=3154700 RepID=UPI0033EFC6E0
MPAPAARPVLIVEHQAPSPDRDSGSLRLYRIIDELQAFGHQVVFFPMRDTADPVYADRLRGRGVAVLTGRARQSRFLSDQGHLFGTAILCRPEPALEMLASIRDVNPECVIAYDTVDLHHHRLSRQADLAFADGTPDRYTLRARAESTRALELMLVRECDVTLVVSEDERRLLLDEVPGADVDVLSNIHRPPGATRQPVTGARILFVGNYLHQPNVDAARRLCTEILPAVRREIPGAVVDLVGDAAPPELTALASDGVTVHGWVPDLGPLYAAARVVAAPLRYGAGVKGKVGEAVEYGVPVVGTPVAVEGMGLVPERDVLVGGTSGELAAQLVRVLRDDSLGPRLAASAGPALAARCGPGVARAALARLVARRRITPPAMTLQSSAV